MSFFNRTLYTAASPVAERPSCFDALAVEFERRGIGPADDAEWHAENICRRMADVDFYAGEIRRILDQTSHTDKYYAAIVIRSLLVSHVSSCKSLLDAGTVALTWVHGLNLKPREQDVSRGKFWSELQAKVGQRTVAFSSARPTFDKIVLWRDASIHRQGPLVIVCGRKHPDVTPVDQHEIKVVADLDRSYSSLIIDPQSINWMYPLDLHTQWRPVLTNWCEELCRDLV